MMTKKKTDTDASARSYVDTALKSLGRSDLPKEDYENAVRRATDALENLRQVRQRSSERREPAASN
jgi:hypothetical protein